MNKESFGDNIQVVVRVRPLSEKECKASDKKCVETSSSIPNSIFLDSKPESKKFVYDWVASEADSQKEIYKRIGEPMAEACLQGYNCTIFAYGQTGAGKTYTMQGRGLLESQGLSDECSKGLQPRVLDHIFHRVRAAIQEGTEALVKCSYFEIYNEQIIDLLNPNAGTLVAREDIKKGTFVEGLTEDTVSTCGEAVNVLVKGARNRHVSSTEMNLESSRSHSVFSMTIEQKRNKEGVTNVVTSKINFVDLAGSERQKATNTTGERLKEAGNINKSLTVLGSVINSLVEVSEGKKTHVRYRDSKLTFLLKDSLGGNSKTAIIANISPSTDSFGETLSTLKFAQRAKLIRNNALINEETSGCIDSLKSEIVRLKSLLAAERDSSKMLTEKTELKPAITFEQECELIKECNTSRHELETLLRESLEILNETDKKLHQEYMKKEEFMALFQKACSMYENKEHHMKLMLKIMRDKTDRVMKGQWDKDSEIESLTRLVDTLRETNENMPSVMKVFQENLHLKHQIVYSNVNGAPSANMLKVMNILRHNMTFMENLHTKLEQGAEQRNRLTKKFEKACLLNGMTAEGLSNINASIENEELKKEKETLGLELLEKKQAEANLKIALEHEQKKLAELNDELQKQRMESQTEVEALEKRIQELNESYNNIQLQGTQISSDYQIREVQLKDQITSLALKRSELVKKLDRVEETLGLLKKTHELEIQTLEKTISQLRLDNMRQQDEITCKKSYNTKLKDENTVLRSEIDSLGSRLKTEVSEKETLTTKVGQMEIELIQLKEKAASNMLEESEASMKLKEKLDEAESEKNQAIQDKQALKEELDTLQQSLDYFKGQLDEKSRVITSLESSKHTLEQNEKTLSATIKTLEEELEKQTQSNSPFNIAIKENHNLRTMLRELRSDMDLAEKKSKRDTESKAHLEKTVESLKESEAYFKAAIKEANLDNQRKSQHLRELSNLLVQNDKEIIELNQAIRNLNDELDSKVADNSSLQETCETLRTDITHLKSRHSFMKNEQAEMKRHLSQKLDEIHAANDRASEAQLRYFTLQQEYDSLKENTERELNLLNNSLKAVNEQNKILMHDKLTKEEEYKKSKSTLITEIASLTTQLKEFKLTMDGIESSENIDQTKVENIRAQIKESIQTGVEELHKVTCENQQLKAELVEKKKNLFILQGKLDTIVKNSTAELLTIKSNSVRLENQYRLAYQSFKLKEEELLKTKEELKFANLEKTGLSHELSQLRFDYGLASSNLEQMTIRCDVYKKQVNNLKEDNDLLNKLNEDHAGPRTRQYKEDRVAIYKNENEKLRKLILNGGSSNKVRKLNAIDVEDEDEVMLAFATEEVRDIIRSIIQKVGHLGICKSRKISKKCDIAILLSTFEKHIDAFAEEEKTVRAQEQKDESVILRCKILEREISVLKQKLSFYGGGAKESTEVDNYVNKKPSYIIKNTQETISSIINLKEALMSYPLKNTSNLPANVPSTPSASKQKSRSIRTPQTEQGDLGKRLYPTQQEERNENEERPKELSLGQAIRAVFFSPASHLNKTKSKKPVKKTNQTLAEEYVGLRATEESALENYDNQASTPRKKVKAD